MLKKSICPLCGNVIVGDHRWEYVCRDCSLRFNFKIEGICLISSDDMDDIPFDDIIRGVLACRYLEIIVIDDGSCSLEKIRNFIRDNRINNCSIRRVNDAPQADTTAYLVYESCPKAKVLFGRKNRIFDVMVSRYHLIPWDTPSMEKANREVDSYLSQCSL